MVFDIMKALAKFYVLMAVVMWAFSVSFYIADDGVEFTAGLHESLWYAFLLIFGMTEIQEQSWITVTTGSLYMVIMVLILMNLLIAVTMDGFERIMERSYITSRAEKAQIICDLELMMSPVEVY